MHIFALRAGATAAQKNTVRRSYLLRLIVTCAALLLLPFAAGTAAILTRSFNESRDASQAIYRQAAQNFGESYQREISRLYAQAVRLSVESANPGKAASAFKLSLFESSAWYYYEAMKAVNLIDADFPPYAMGVYFYDGDVLITQNGKYTLDSYLKIHGGAPENSERLREFFTGSYAGRGGGMSYCPVLSRDGAYELTFAGADVVFRARRDRALIFYQLAPPTFPMSERIPGADYVAIDGSTGETLFSTREGVAANFSAAMDGAGAEIAVGAGIDSAAAAGAATVAAGAAMDSAGAGASSGVGASSAIGASSGAAAAAGTAAAEATATGAAGTGATVPSASAAAAGAAKPTAPLAAGATAYDAAKATSQLADDGERYAIFTAADPAHNAIYACLIPLQETLQSATLFYRATMIALGLFSAALVALFALSVYINYAPVRRLAKKISPAAVAEGEFRAIESAFEALSLQAEDREWLIESLNMEIRDKSMLTQKMAEEMSERNMAILDMLLANLLTGAPFPLNEASRLGLAAHPGWFCVCALFGGAGGTSSIGSGGGTSNTVGTVGSGNGGGTSNTVGMGSEGNPVGMVGMSSGGGTISIGSGSGTISTSGMVGMVGTGGTAGMGSAGGAASLSAGQRAALSADIMKTFGIKVYITDVLHEDHTVIVALLKDNSVRELENFLARYAAERLGESWTALAGPAAPALSGIRQSYQSCMSAYAKLAKTKAARSAAGAGTGTGADCAGTGAGAGGEGAGTGGEGAGTGAPDGENSPRECLTHTVERFVREHFADAGLNQVIVAEKFGLSIYSLSRLFSKDIGTGFSEYITALRMDQAKRLLLATDRSVGEIAQAVGIPNVNYFFRRFKECVGKTPAKFRQEGKNAQP